MGRNRGVARWRLRLAAVAIGAPVLTAGLLGAGTTRAGSLDQFGASVTAVGLQVRIANPAVIPLGVPIELESPRAASSLDSLGVVSSQASNPYPGDNTRGLPGLAGSVSGFPFPGFPFFVQSTDAEPKPRPVKGPGYSMTAENDSGSTTATATTGGESPTGGLAEATTSIIRGEDGSVTVSGVAVDSAVRLDPVLSIGQVKTTVTLVQRPGSPLERSAVTTVDGLTVAGFGVAVRNGELVAAASRQPIAVDPQISKALQEQNITLSLTKAEPIDDDVAATHGVVAGGLAVTMTKATEGTAAGTTTVSINLARVVASYTGTADAGTGPDAAGESGAGTSAPTAPPVSGDVSPTPDQVPSESEAPGAGPATEQGFQASTGLTYAASAAAGIAPPAAFETEPSLDSAGASTPVPEAPAEVESTGGSAPSAPAAGVGEPPSLQALAGVRKPVPVDLQPVFLAVAAAGILVIGGGKLIQHIGIRENGRWS
jgi:hypothetical protein